MLFHSGLWSVSCNSLLCEVDVQFHSFCHFGDLVVRVPFTAKTYALSIELSWHFCWKQLTVCVDVFWTPWSSVPLILFLFLCQCRTVLIILLCSKFWNWDVWVFQLCSFFSRLFWLFWDFCFFLFCISSVNFRINLSVSTKSQ